MERQVAEQGFSKGKEKLPQKQPQKQQQPSQSHQSQQKQEIKQEKPEIKPVEKKEEKKIEEKKVKKEMAYVYGSNLPVSTKTSMALCRFIKNKNPSQMIFALEKVQNMQIAVPFKGEIPHRKGFKEGYARGRYPLKTSGYFIKLLKSLVSNAKTNNMDAEKIIVTIAKADKASSPVRGTRMGFGRKRFKRSNIYIEAREKTKNKHNEKNKKSTK